MENCKEYQHIEVLPYGLWSEKTKLTFLSGEGSLSTVFKKSRIPKYKAISLDVDSIDDLCAAEKVTLIKMDIEGSEQEALRGAEKVIKRDKPRLAICIYHKPEDFYEIPLMIKAMVPEYKLYIRHHSESWHETVVYATL